MRLIEKVIPPSGKHSATVIFFHGTGDNKNIKFPCKYLLILMSTGDTGRNLIEWVKFLLGRNLEIPHVKFIFPTAPVQRYYKSLSKPIWRAL